MRLVSGSAALVLVVACVWLGMTPKAIHLGDCGSPFFPADPSGMTSDVADECAGALGRRETLLWWALITAAALATLAALGGVLGPERPAEERERSAR